MVVTTEIPRSGFVQVLLWIYLDSRTNWIHSGSPLAGPRVAASLSVTERCRRLNISTREYLKRCFPAWPRFEFRNCAGLTRAAWAARSR
jgi:hypothetical protein